MLPRQVRLLQARLAEGDQRLKELLRASQRQLDAASMEVPAHCMHTHVTLPAQAAAARACSERFTCLPPSTLQSHARREPPRLC